MPELSSNTPADRAQYSLTDTRPRSDGTLINSPADILEGAGDMTTLDRDDNPVDAAGRTAFTVEASDRAGDWYGYLGTDPEGINGPTKQTAALSVERDSFIASGALFAGDLPPSLLAAANLPRPITPILKAESVDVQGYPASTVNSPYFIALSNGRQYTDGALAGEILHSSPGPPVLVPPTQTGQSIRVALHTDTPEFTTHIGIWMTEPGTSTPTTPGRFRLQAEVEVRRFNPGEHVLGGPYRYGDTSAEENSTLLQPPPGPLFEKVGNDISRLGSYLAYITWSDESGQTALSADFGHIVAYPNEGGADARYGRGSYRVYRPLPPRGAIGWRAYIATTLTGTGPGTFYTIYYPAEGIGNEKPLPITMYYAETNGWFSPDDNQYALNDTSFLVAKNPPNFGTTGLESPTEAPPEPVVFGESRPPAGTYYGLVTETVRGKEGPPSLVASVTTTSNEVPRLIHRTSYNLLPNGDNAEVGADGLPLDHTYVTTNGTITADSKDILLKTSASTAGTTPSVTTYTIDVDPTKDWRARTEISAENPPTGTFQGSTDVVLEELSASGSVTTTVLGTLSAVGGLSVNKPIYKAGSTGLPGGSVIWQATTTQARLLIRLSGANKNMTVRIGEKRLVDYIHADRLNSSGVFLESSDAFIDVPPEPVLPPEPAAGGSPALSQLSAPDRPSYSGTALETKADFESALPTGWSTNATNATLTRATDASLVGSGYLKSLKSAGGSSGSAFLSEYIAARTTTLSGAMDASQITIPVSDLSYWPNEGTVLVGSEKMTYTGKSAPNGAGNLTGVTRAAFSTSAAIHSSGATASLLDRHDGAISTKCKIPTMPSNGSITLQEMRRHQGERFAWVDLNNFREKVQLDLSGAPTASGNVTTTLDENGTMTPRNAAVTSTKEVRSLTINNPQTASGNVTITLNGVVKVIPIPGGIRHKIQIQYAQSVTSNGTFYISLLSPSSTVITKTFQVLAGDSPSTIASKAAASPPTGFTGTSSGSTVIYEASASGLYTVNNAYWEVRPTPFTSIYQGFTLTTLTEGAASLTAAQVAEVLRFNAFSGWQIGGSSATVTFTALEPGVRSDTYSYSAGTTGATSTSGITQTTAGAQTTTDGVATAIRALYSGNAYWTVSGTGSQVIWTATSSGAKQDATFSPAATGVVGTMQTTEQGSTDLVAYTQDSAGAQTKRRVLANIAITTIPNIETAVAGAGTENAVVSVWGSFTNDAKVLLWRVPLDLSDHPLGQIAYGVTAESSTALTWEVHTDEALITNRGETYYEEHDDSSGGKLLRQFIYNGFSSGAASSNDKGIQELSLPVLPGEQITLAAKLRYENIPLDMPAKPLYVAAYHSDGTITELRDVTGVDGVSGSASWYEPTYLFNVPDDPELAPCYEIRVSSRDLSLGTIVMQRIAVSPGPIPLRTGHYATAGTFRAEFDSRTPKETPVLQLARRRVALETQYQLPTGASASTQYRSASDSASFGVTWYSDPEDVPDLPVVQSEGTLLSDGLEPVVVHIGYPRLEYVLLGRENPLPVLLAADRTEFDGTVVLATTSEWYRDPETNIAKLPSGHVRRAPAHPPVGYVPKLSLRALRPETVTYLDGNWGSILVVLEQYGEALTLKLLAKPEFERLITSRYDVAGSSDRWSSWLSKEIPAEVVRVKAIPQ